MMLLRTSVEIHDSCSPPPPQISIIGISNTVFRVVAGWVSDFDGVSALALTNASIALSGICVILMPWCSGSYAAYVCVALVCKETRWHQRVYCIHLSLYATTGFWRRRRRLHLLDLHRPGGPPRSGQPDLGLWPAGAFQVRLESTMK